MVIEIKGKEYRAAFNMNALSDFEELSGKDILTLFDSDKEVNIAKDLGIRGMVQFCYACITEGQRLAGEPMDITIKDLGAELNTALINQIFTAFSANFNGGGSDSTEKKIEKKALKK